MPWEGFNHHLWQNGSLQEIKTTSFQFFDRNEAIDSFMKMSITFMGMIAYGHGNSWYAYYSLNIFLDGLKLYHWVHCKIVAWRQITT